MTKQVILRGKPQPTTKTPLRIAVENLFTAPQKRMPFCDETMDINIVNVPDGTGNGNFDINLTWSNGEAGTSPTTIGIEIPDTDHGKAYKVELLRFLAEKEINVGSGGVAGRISISEDDFGKIGAELSPSAGQFV